MGMLSLSLRFQGLREIIGSLNGASGRLDAELEKRMRVLVLEVAGSSQRYIVGSRATNPGDILGIVTGRLRGSIAGHVERKGAGMVEGIVGPQRVKYAATHEFGDPSRNIPARPYLSRGLADKRQRILDYLGSAFSASVAVR